MKKILLGLSLLIVLFSCENKDPKTVVNNDTLLIFTDGKLINYNLEQDSVTWQYQSLKDPEDNRNHFVISENIVYAPFESGAFIAFDINTGKELWKQQIYGNGADSDGIITAFEDEDDNIVTSEEYEYNLSGGKGPLFMGQPMVFADKVYVLSTGRPYEAQSAAYAFDKVTGEKIWITNLPYPYNHYAPVTDGEYLYVNSAVLLKRLGLKTGSEYSMGLQEFDFESPLYNQMVSDRRRFVFADERGRVYSLNFKNFGKLQDLLGDDALSYNLSQLYEEQKKKVFEWTFRDGQENSSYISADRLYMDGDNVYFFANTNDIVYFYKLDKETGKLDLKKEFPSAPISYSEYGKNLIGYTESMIFSIKKKNGELDYEIPFQETYMPISNIVQKGNDELIYFCKQGIVLLDVDTKEFKLLNSGLTFKGGEHNYTQIQYLKK